jgi:tRNA threonylcarbamoyladenosine dehydratase
MLFSALPFSTGDVALVFEDFSQSRSAVPPHSVCARPALVRWDPTRPLSLENCVLVEERELTVHGWFVDSSDVNSEESSSEQMDAGEPLILVDAVGEPAEPQAKMRKPELAWGAEVAQAVMHRLDQARKFRRWALQ